MANLEKIELGDVATTGLFTLYCHAIESKSKNPMLKDPKAVEIVGELNKVLSKSDKKLDKIMVKEKIKKMMVATIAIRAKRFDQYVTDFLNENPNGVVVNMGCGLDSRFSRIDNGKVVFYDLDLPEMIEIKKQFYKETLRYHLIGCSVLDHKWMNLISKEKGPFLFMAEGLFMYLDQKDVEELVLTFQKRFPDSDLVCEVFNSFWLKKPFKKMINFKLRREFHFGNVSFNFGIRNSNEMEQWNKGIKFLDEWCYFDANEKKLGLLNLLGKFDVFRKTQWTVHYRLN